MMKNVKILIKRWASTRRRMLILIKWLKSLNMNSSSTRTKGPNICIQREKYSIQLWNPYGRLGESLHDNCRYLWPHISWKASQKDVKKPTLFILEKLKIVKNESDGFSSKQNPKICPMQTVIMIGNHSHNHKREQDIKVALMQRVLFFFEK